jgi:hypothetical protein
VPPCCAGVEIESPKTKAIAHAAKIRLFIFISHP